VVISFWVLIFGVLLPDFKQLNGKAEPAASRGGCCSLRIGRCQEEGAAQIDDAGASSVVPRAALSLLALLSLSRSFPPTFNLLSSRLLSMMMVL
jgi:hypothetical protein